MLRISRFSTSLNPNILLISKLRKASECSISKAKLALQNVGNDYEKALDWISKDSIKSADAKAAKLAGRIAVEGLVGIQQHPLGLQASMIEINCETDFVAKSSLFVELVRKTCNSALVFQNASNDSFSDVNIDELVLKTSISEDINVDQEPELVGTACNRVIGKLGEKITIRRGVVGLPPPSKHTVFGAYAHAAGQSLPPGVGRIGSLVVLESTKKLDMEARTKLVAFAKKLSQHISGFNPKSVGFESTEIDDDSILLNQSFLFGGGTVQDVLKRLSEELDLGLIVRNFVRWECGEGLEKPESNFAAEVQQQIKEING
jgi:elongation factor Ts